MSDVTKDIILVGTLICNYGHGHFVSTLGFITLSGAFREQLAQ